MIHKFTVKNFYSIKDEVTVDLTSRTKSVALDALYLDGPFGEKITKIAFVGGPNGSGKTNLLRTLGYFAELISPKTAQPELAWKHFPFTGETSRVSKISVDFSVDKNLYTYSIVFSQSMIIEEEVQVESLVSTRKTSKKVFSRIWSEGSQEYRVELSDRVKNLKNVEKIGLALSSDTAKRRTVTDIYVDLDSTDGDLRKIKRFWSNFYTNITAFGSVDSENAITLLASDSMKNLREKEAARSLSEEMLRKIDIGFSRIRKYERDGDSEKDLYAIEHIFRDNNFVLFPIFESTGTNRILYLIDKISDMLSRDEGGVLVLDDFDAYVHPDIYDMLIEYLISPVKNKNGTQFIFSSHNYTTLNLLDKQQIILAERNEYGATTSWRLDDIKGVDLRDNFYAKYLAGAYGGVPRTSL